jgi:hypothetical protein
MITPEAQAEAQMAEQARQEQEYKDLFDYQTAIVSIKNTIADFSTDVSDAKQRRLERYADIDPEELRQGGDIAQDETFIADRLIDGNIMRDIPDKAGFLLADGKLGDFRCVSRPAKEAKKVEEEFTKGLTYSGWYKDWYRTMDGSELHGRDYLEVVFDPTKPLHVGFEHVGYERLFFNRKVENIQDSERVIRQYDMTLLKLRTMNKFSPEVTQVIYDKYKDKRRDECIKVYKIYTKFNNCVYVHWYTEDADVHDWLAPVEKLYIGVDIEHEEMVEQEIPMTDQLGMPLSDEMGMPLMTKGMVPQKVMKPMEMDMYPIFTYIYREDEQECLVEKKGRGFLDFPMQEANTCIITAFVNGAVRASGLYASPKQMGDSDGADIKQIDTVIEPNRVYNTPLEFWGPAYPDVTLLQAVQFLQTMNAQSAGKFSFATNNRKDSRKTAKELGLAEQEENKVKSTDLATFAEFVRAVLSYSWLIVQNRAKQNKIPFLQIEQQMPMAPGIPEAGGAPIMMNDVEAISQVYDIRPAGEAAMEREQKAMKIQQDYPVFQATPLGQRLLEEYVKIRYPENAEEFVSILQAGDVGKMLVQSYAQLLQAFMQPEEWAALPPDQKQKLLQLATATQQYLTNGQQTNIPQGSGQNNANAGAGQSPQGASSTSQTGVEGAPGN